MTVTTSQPRDRTTGRDLIKKAGPAAAGEGARLPVRAYSGDHQIVIGPGLGVQPRRDRVTPFPRLGARCLTREPHEIGHFLTRRRLPVADC